MKQQDPARGDRKNRFLWAVKSAPMMIWISGTDKGCTACSEAWLEFTGRSMQAEMGNGWTEGIHPDDLNECIAAYVDSFDRRVPFQRKYRFRHNSGEYRWIFEIGVPRFDEKGTFLGYIGSCIDFTDRNLAEVTRADLERRVLAGQEQERERIARELHDDINQRIALLVYELKEMVRRPSGEEERWWRFIESMSDQLTRVADDIHAISHRLHSSHLEYLGLASAAEILCRELRARHEVNIEFSTEGIRRDLPKEISLCLYRVLQEGLQNAIKHSKAELIQVELSGNESAIRLTIRDNGVGFDPTIANDHEGLGLISMRERMRLVHGDFSLRSAPGTGTMIKCSVTIGEPLH